MERIAAPAMSAQPSMRIRPRSRDGETSRNDDGVAEVRQHLNGHQERRTRDAGLASGKVMVRNSVKPVAPRLRPAVFEHREYHCSYPSMTRKATGKNAMVCASHSPCQPKILTFACRRPA